MTVRILPVDGVGARKIKAHKKSRNGCTNCKLRSVKCDEFRPACKRCIRYGVSVSCSYSRSPVADESLLQHPSELTTSIMTLSSFSPPFFPDKRSELFAKFQNRTAITVTAGGRIPLYQNEILGLARSNAHLRSAIFALTLLHDQHLCNSAVASPCAPSSFTSSHYSKAINSFHLALTHAHTLKTQSNPPLHPLNIHAQAALWTTSAILGSIAFCNIEATSPFDSWPLRPYPLPSDLDWLKMNDGKKSVQALTLELETDKMYAPLLEVQTGSLLPKSSIEPRLERLPSELLAYFDLDRTSEEEARGGDENFYRPSLILLARVYNNLQHQAHNIENSPDAPSISTSESSPASSNNPSPPFFITTILTFWTWTTACLSPSPPSSPSFPPTTTTTLRHLLQTKDPKALLILAFWWAEIYQTTVWWLVTRARIEGMSICLYLERYYDWDGGLMGLVGGLKRIFSES